MSSEITRLSVALCNVEVLECEPYPRERRYVQERYLFYCPKNELRISVIRGAISMEQWELAVLAQDSKLVGVPGIMESSEPVRLESTEEMAQLINRIASYS